MANELKHADIGNELTKSEWEATTTHIANNQAANDMLYFNGTTWIRATTATILSLLKIAKAVKLADETVNNSNTLQNDDALLFAVSTNDRWGFIIQVVFTGHVDGDIKFAITTPGGTHCNWTGVGYTGGTLTQFTIINATTSQAVDTNGATERSLVIIGEARTTAAGNMQLQWAQSTAHASDTKVLAGSWLVAWKVN